MLPNPQRPYLVFEMRHAAFAIAIAALLPPNSTPNSGPKSPIPKNLCAFGNLAPLSSGEGLGVRPFTLGHLP